MKYDFFLMSRLFSTFSSFCELLTCLLLSEYCSGDAWSLLVLSRAFLMEHIANTIQKAQHVDVDKW